MKLKSGWDEWRDYEISRPKIVYEVLELCCFEWFQNNPRFYLIIETGFRAVLFRMVPKLETFKDKLRPVNYLSVGNANAYEEGKISDRLLEKLGWLWDKVYADPAFNDVRPLPQLHTLVYDNKRGV